MFQELDDLEVCAESALDETVHAQQQERLTACVEEIIIDSDVRSSQQFAPDRDELLLRLSPRGRPCFAGLQTQGAGRLDEGCGFAAPFNRHFRQQIGDSRCWLDGSQCCQNSRKIVRYCLDRATVDATCVVDEPQTQLLARIDGYRQRIVGCFRRLDRE